MLPPITTAPIGADPVAAATALAAELADAYAYHDWSSARRLSPTPEFSDATYEQGFGQLFHVDLIVVHAEQVLSVVRLWLAEIANENVRSGVRTSLYCVRWDVDVERSTITRVSGRTVKHVGGVVEPTSWSADATAACGP